MSSTDKELFPKWAINIVWDDRLLTYKELATFHFPDKVEIPEGISSDEVEDWLQERYGLQVLDYSLIFDDNL